MKELILGVIALTFATAYNAIIFILNTKYADGEFEYEATFLMAVNTIKDAAILGIILYNIFLR